MSFCRTMVFRAVSAREFTSQIVGTEGEYLIAKGQGWTDSPKEAFALFEAEAERIGNEAAYRAADDRTMSEKAQQEVADYEKTVPGHVPVIPEQVRKPRSKKTT